MDSKLVLYNTLTRRKEVFEPITPGRVGMYVCGPTVYGDPHLGHARPAVTFDLLFRYLKASGYKVRYVRNITDVGHLEHDADEGEDKIAKKARLEQLEPMEVAHYYTERYHHAMDALNVETPSIEPCASGHIIEQIAFVKRILDAGYAYVSNGSVYFDVEKYNAAYNYGGVSSTIREASQLLGVDISHYAEVNFENMVQLVDAVGGVDVEVTERIDDTDADNTTDNPNGKRIIIEEGLQHLDGEQALVFARSRAFVDGDFTRTANQRKLIMALVNKVLDMPVTELPGVIQGAAKCVTTDLSVTDIVALAEQFKGKGDLTVYSAMAPTVFMDQLVNGQSFVLNDPTATKQMMKTIEEGGDPSTIVGVSGVGPGGYTSGSGYYSEGSYDDYSDTGYAA